MPGRAPGKLQTHIERKTAMPAEKCEFCGRYGAKAGRYNDTFFNPLSHPKGKFYTLYLCLKCHNEKMEEIADAEKKAGAKALSTTAPQ